MKSLFLLRGVPGSGKSTLAKHLGGEDDYCHKEADMYFVDSDGNYNFDPSKRREAHAWCHLEVKKEMAKGTNKVIVSNTFTQEWEMNPYRILARVYGYTVFSLIVENRHGGVDVHGVPEEKLVQMETNLRNSIKLR